MAEKPTVLTAGGAGTSTKSKNKRRHRGGGRGRHKGNKVNNASGDEREHHSAEDEGQTSAVAPKNTQTKDTEAPPVVVAKEEDQNHLPANDREPAPAVEHHLEIEDATDHLDEDAVVDVVLTDPEDNYKGGHTSSTPYSDHPDSKNRSPLPPLPKSTSTETTQHQLLWLFICFMGIMASFVCYGLLLEYTTSGGRKLHELSFLFVTSGLYTITAATGRYVRDETPSTIPPARFAILGLTSMGSTFCSVRSLRYVIFPIQVLAKSCKPVPVMLMGAVMGKRYPVRKYINVVMIVLGVALFMGGGDNKKKAGSAASDDADNMSSAGQLFGILLLFVSLCFDGGTGAYEDKLMSVYQVQPFDLMFNIQLGKTILAGIGLLVLNQLHIFLQMIREMGFLLVALGLTGAMGQIFIFVTIAKFGALTCSIIGLSRKVTTLVASIYFYGHSLNAVQFLGLSISVGAMVANFWGKKKGGGGHGHGGPPPPQSDEELQKMLGDEEEEDVGDVELANGK